MERVLEEAKAVFTSSAEKEGPEYSAFKDLGYSANALKEALRKYAIVPVVTRQVHTYSPSSPPPIAKPVLGTHIVYPH
jgi:hypothetical protein